LQLIENIEILYNNTKIDIDPEVAEVTLTPEDEFLILACDGLWDVIENQVSIIQTQSQNGEANYVFRMLWILCV
jgi:serine/threonine protein phosphatase PrpC